MIFHDWISIQNSGSPTWCKSNKGNPKFVRLTGLGIEYADEVSTSNCITILFFSGHLASNIQSRFHEDSVSVSHYGTEQQYQNHW